MDSIGNEVKSVSTNRRFPTSVINRFKSLILMKSTHLNAHLSHILNNSKFEKISTNQKSNFNSDAFLQCPRDITCTRYRLIDMNFTVNIQPKISLSQFNRFYIINDAFTKRYFPPYQRYNPTTTKQNG